MFRWRLQPIPRTVVFFGKGYWKQYPRKGHYGRDFFLKIAMPKSQLVGISPSRTPLVTLMWRDVMVTLLPLGLGTVFRGDTDPNWSSLSSFLKRIWF